MNLHALSTYIFLSISLLLACQPPKDQEADTATISQSSTEQTTVKCAVASLQNFPVQIVANGKLTAHLQSKLQFKTQGIIRQVLVSNSASVQAGQTLAILDNDAQLIALQQAQDQLQEARIELNKLVIEYGGLDNDTNSVKPRILGNLKVKSGYVKALTNLRNAHLQVENTYLKAPYTGVVANLKAKPYNPTSVEPFCTLLSREALLVEFPVLESELGAVALGQNARIMPLALPNKQYNGKVAEINPLVSEQGLVSVKVKISNPDKTLLEGMNLRVVIEKNIAQQVSVPKEAVVERSGRKVVFVYENGLAKWHYVTVAHENMNSIALSEGIKVGERVIVEGNLNLGHDAKVKLSVE